MSRSLNKIEDFKGKYYLIYIINAQNDSDTFLIECMEASLVSVTIKLIGLFSNAKKP